MDADFDRIEFVENYNKGIDVLKTSPQRAVELLEISADSGYPKALYMLGEIYSNEKYGIALDYKKAEKYFERTMQADQAIVRNTTLYATYKKSLTSYKALNSPLTKYVENADPGAAYFNGAALALAYLQLDGKLGKPNEKRAIEYFNKFEGGYGHLAMLYYQGFGAIRQDKIKGLQMMKNSFERKRTGNELTREGQVILGTTLLTEAKTDYGRVMKSINAIESVREKADVSKKLLPPILDKLRWEICPVFPQAFSTDPKNTVHQQQYRIRQNCEDTGRSVLDSINYYRKLTEGNNQSVSQPTAVRTLRCRQVVIERGVCINMNLGPFSAGSTCTPDFTEERCE